MDSAKGHQDEATHTVATVRLGRPPGRGCRPRRLSRPWARCSVIWSCKKPVRSNQVDSNVICPDQIADRVSNVLLRSPPRSSDLSCIRDLGADHTSQPPGLTGRTEIKRRAHHLHLLPYIQREEHRRNIRGDVDVRACRVHVVVSRRTTDQLERTDIRLLRPPSSRCASRFAVAFQKTGDEIDFWSRDRDPGRTAPA